jgi:hypothetical protein
MSKKIALSEEDQLKVTRKLQELSKDEYYELTEKYDDDELAQVLLKGEFKKKEPMPRDPYEEAEIKERFAKKQPKTQERKRFRNRNRS